MKRDRLVQTVNKRFEKIAAAYERIMIDLGKAESLERRRFEVEDIHAFRVEVKKLRAFMHLVLPEAGHPIPDSLHAFYQALGVVRNLQLQEKRMTELHGAKARSFSGYLALLDREMEVAVEQARSEGLVLFLPHEEQRVLDQMPENVGTNTLHEFLWRMDAKIRALTRPGASLDDDNLHTIRKCLKDLGYNHRHLPDEAAHILPPSLVAGSAKLEPFLKILGEFQDLRSGLEWLEPSVTGIVSDEHEKKLLGVVRRKWEKEKEAVRRQFRVLYLPIFSRVLNPGH